MIVHIVYYRDYNVIVHQSLSSVITHYNIVCIIVG